MRFKYGNHIFALHCAEMCLFHFGLGFFNCKLPKWLIQKLFYMGYYIIININIIYLLQ